jgi:Domain of unknown function (DUF4252)
MKKYILYSLFATFSLVAKAQLPVWAFYHSQLRGNGVVKFAVPGLVIKSASLFLDKEDQEIKHLLRKLGTVRVVIAEGKQNAFCDARSKRLIRRLYRHHYEDLLAVKDGSERVNIMVKERRGKIRRYLLFVNSEYDSVMISGKCNLSPEDFLQLTKDKNFRSKIKSGKTKVNISLKR